MSSTNVNYFTAVLNSALILYVKNIADFTKYVDKYYSTLMLSFSEQSAAEMCTLPISLNNWITYEKF